MNNAEVVIKAQNIGIGYAKSKHNNILYNNLSFNLYRGELVLSLIHILFIVIIYIKHLSNIHLNINNYGIAFCRTLEDQNDRTYP